ncbi:hypothetical protein MMC34_005585 [Xylographa carneopallida]|nr:hypothetical protein [Xylographa carneopallida]
MASHNSPPCAPQNPQRVADLLRNLEAGVKKSKGGFSCKKSTFKVSAADGVTVDSWRFSDWDYKRDDLPTYARGLFTYRTKQGIPEIAVRGYDKFFNVGEVNDTQWRNVETGTKGPYEMSVKENGCIIFMAGLENDVLLVCSKHSTGARQDADLSHAVAGEKWVEKHLSTIGKTRQDLARELRNRNVTAVAELCDDTFEEHVLAYDEKSAGLYIHGMNLNLPEFATYPGPLVHKFSDQWGFKKAEYLFKDDIESVKIFLDGCAESGSFEGKDTEGFVIRCQKSVGGKGGPYVDWFFKYKFEEPYLLYRQWRECTKAIISGRAPKYKKHKKITEEYLLYARRQLAQDPHLGKAYNANHGIIRMRDGFLQERGLNASDIIRDERSGEEQANADVLHNVVLVPVATIGCGKTTVAIALTKLFRWGHIQNDNITGQKGRPKQFAIQLCNSMAQHPVVIADRNNHQKRERKQVIDDVSQVVPDVRFVALHYVHDPKPQMLPEIQRVTRERVLNRGDNHQTIRAGSKDKSEILGIMNGFLDRFEPLDPETEPDSGFDEVINLDVIESSRHNLETTVNALRAAYPKLIPEAPSADELDEAIAAALNEYQPDIKHDLSFQSKNKNKGLGGAKSSNWRENQKPAQEPKSKSEKIEYFCLRVPTTQVLSILESTFQSQVPTISRFYRQLQQTRRVQPSFHITLIHRSSMPQHKDLWQRLTSLNMDASASQGHVPDPVLGKCHAQLERVVWDERVMSIVARIVDLGWESVNTIPHVTIGTANSSIKPKESNDLLMRWLNRGASEETGIHEILLRGEADVYGEVKAVLPETR